MSGPARSPEAREQLAVEGFDLLGMLGLGGMGVVYKARQKKLNRLVALKMILAGQGATREQIERFQSEAEAVARLDHPNIVHVYMAGEAAGYPFIALEYVDGPTLAELWDGWPQPPRQAAESLRTLALAIHYAHGHNIVHRDLKPGNVLVANGWAPTVQRGVDDTLTLNDGPLLKIADFGLAKQLDEQFDISHSGQLIGTPSYMAPEQAAGRKDIGPSVDVYALGTMLYCALTGRPPFRGETEIDTLDMVRWQEPVPPGQLQPKIPVDLETICLRSLQKEAGKRYASAQALADDLGRFLRHEPIIGRPVSRGERIWRWCKKNRSDAWLGLGLALLTVALIGASWGLTVWAFREKAEAKLSAERASQEKELSERTSYAATCNEAYQDYKAGRIDHVMRWLKEQESKRPQRGFEWSYLRALCRLDFCTLTVPKGKVLAAAFSPDGRWLAGAGEDGVVRVWVMATGQVVFSWQRQQAIVRSLAFSPDGKQLVLAGSDGALRRWDFVSGTEPDTLNDDAWGVWSVAYSPDGRWLAAGSADGTVRLWNAVTWKQGPPLRGHSDIVRCVRFTRDGRKLASADNGGLIKIWDVLSGRELRTLSGGGPLSSVDFSCDRDRLAAAGEDTVIRLWDIDQGEYVALEGHTRPVTGVTFSPDGKHLASCSQDGTARVWDVFSRKQCLVFGHEQRVNDIAYSPDGRKLGSATEGCIKIWDATASLESWAWHGHTDTVTCIAASPDGNAFASGSKDQSVKIWDSATGEDKLTLAGHTGTVATLAFGGRDRLISGSEDRTIRIWDLQTSDTVHVLRGHTDAVRSIAVTPDGRWIISGGNDQTVIVWDANSGDAVAMLPSGMKTVLSVAVSPERRLVAWAGLNEKVMIWDFDDRHEPLALTVRIPRILKLAFQPGTGHLACGGTGGIIELWDVATAEKLFGLRGCQSDGDELGGIAFSPEGNELASASATGTVKLWDPVTGQELVSLEPSSRVQDQICFGVCFSANGQQLACAGSDWLVRVWDASPDTEAKRVHREAQSLMRFWYAQGIDEAAIRARIMADPTVSEDIRKQALEQMPKYARREVECEAARLVRQLFGQALFRDEVIERIRTEPETSEAVRQRGLELTCHHLEDADALDKAAWRALRHPLPAGPELDRALRQAEAANRIIATAPVKGKFPTTLGVAYYRAGRYQEAVRVLAEAERIYPFPPNLAVLAMAHFRLGEVEEARAEFQELQGMMDQAGWARNPVAKSFYREAECMLRPRSSASTR
jgi:WD40 repeat protein/tRNA A-37 threonylcarbamoyl transferase component Bud32